MTDAGSGPRDKAWVLGAETGSTNRGDQGCAEATTDDVGVESSSGCHANYYSVLGVPITVRARRPDRGSISAPVC